MFERKKEKKREGRDGGIKFRMKDGVGLDPRKHNFQQTVGSVICDCEKLGNRKKKQKNKWFSLEYIVFCNRNIRRKQMRKGTEGELKMRLG